MLTRTCLGCLAVRYRVLVLCEEVHFVDQEGIITASTSIQTGYGTCTTLLITTELDYCFAEGHSLGGLLL
jgi:hypothetical protein